MTIDCNARRSPRFTAATTPAAGDVWRTPVRLSSTSGDPRSTRSPTFTRNAGLTPT